ncbi:hypothetical protein G7Z17_g5686 [Cylindrodendrum hubeiense]|uniref:F-box domain-containing protein n=1 Tax=Cylindrodendrum hubeiense TaxID=595255 RepID=A0A9P5LHK9_9HYPO|nr:hypothetical protein G7Z17_g5686 [Cylindrodendrum hubeiense]
MDIQAIPDELWAQIFSQLECELPNNAWNRPVAFEVDPHPLRPLYSLSLVCRHFQRIAQPILYRTIDNIKSSSYHSFRLLRTLLTRPRLAQSVHTLNIEDGVHPVPGLKSLIAAAVRHVQIPPRFRSCLEKTLLDECGSTFGGFAALALALMPNAQHAEVFIHRWPASTIWLLSGSWEMEETHIYEEKRLEDEEDWQNDIEEDDSYDYSPPLATTKEVAAEEVDPHSVEVYANYGLPYLKELCVYTGDSNDEASSMAEYEPLLLHPGIEILRLDGIDWRTDQVAKMKWNNRTCHVHTLDLVDSFVDHVGLLDIFTRCPQLRCLLIHLGESYRDGFGPIWPDDEEEGWVFNVVEFSQVLNTHGKALMELDIDTSSYRDDDKFEGRHFIETVMGSLKGMKALRKLKISEDELLLDIEHEITLAAPPPLGIHKVLPANIEELEFPRHDFGAFYEICDLIEGGCFKKLRHVILGSYHGMPPQSPCNKVIPGWDISFQTKYVGATFDWKGKEKRFVEFSRLD